MAGQVIRGQFGRLCPGPLGGRSCENFRNRIRHAFSNGAEVGESTVELGGETLGATRVIIRPFSKDPKLGSFPQLTEKWYEFVLAPEVPGGLYRIRTVVPSAAGGAPLIENRLTFAGR